MTTFDRAPIDINKVIDPAWLSQALSVGRDPVQVASVEVLEKIGFVAINVRVRVTYETPCDLPTALCIKGVFDEEYADVYLKTGIQMTEGLFYRDAAPLLTVRVPAFYYAGADPETQAAIIIMEDLTVRGVRFMSVLDAYTLEQIHQSLDQLARVHGGLWGRDKLKQIPWLIERVPLLATGASGVPADMLTGLLNDGRGEMIPATVLNGDRVYAAMAALAARAPKVDACLLHGDSHAGNLFESAEGIGLLDWQVAQLGNWSIDVAYHMASTLDPEVRRNHEKDLLRYYLTRLAEHGGTPPAWDDAWRLYRESTVYGYFMWGVTRRVTPSIIKQFITRLGGAVADHDGFGLLGV